MVSVERVGGDLVARTILLSISDDGEGEFYGATSLLEFAVGERLKSVQIYVADDSIPEVKTCLVYYTCLLLSYYTYRLLCYAYVMWCILLSYTYLVLTGYISILCWHDCRWQKLISCQLKVTVNHWL